MKKLLLLICVIGGAWQLYQQYQHRQAEAAAVAATAAAAAAALAPPTVEAVTGVLVMGESHALVLAANGELYGWGANENKELGLAHLRAATAPVALPGPSRWRAVHAGTRASYAIAVDGQLWRRSFNSWSYQGGDKLAERMEYTPVFPAQRWRKAEEGRGIGMGLDEAGSLWLWREEKFASAPHPDPAADAAVTSQAVGSDKRWRDFCIDQGSFIAIDSDGALWRGPAPRDGHSSFLQGVAEGDSNEPELTQVAASARFLRVFCRASANQRMALDEDYRLWGFGHNTFNELGDGDGNPFTGSKPVTTLTRVTNRTWIDIAVGHGFTVGIAGDGTLWAWGNNASGQLGIGNYEYKDIPTLVDKRPIWRAVSAGMSMAAALTQNGQVYVWGQRSMRGPRGETISLLGDGGVAELRLTPTPVAATVIWKTEN